MSVGGPSSIRSNMIEISALGLGSPRSCATRRRMYSANEMPSSAALACARRCISGSMVICVRAFMMAPSCHHSHACQGWSSARQTVDYPSPPCLDDGLGRCPDGLVDLVEAKIGDCG